MVGTAWGTQVHRRRCLHQHLVMISYSTSYLHLDELLCVEPVTDMAHLEVIEGIARLPRMLTITAGFSCFQHHSQGNRGHRLAAFI